MESGTDWKVLVRSRAPELDEAELERVAAPLAALEARFRPLAREIPLNLDPAPVFRAGAEQGE
jgi:hypothetical protein